jgi:hypothetical protein
VPAEQREGLNDLLSRIGFAAGRAKGGKRYPVGPAARECCGESSIVLNV